MVLSNVLQVPENKSKIFFGFSANQIKINIKGSLNIGNAINIADRYIIFINVINIVDRKNLLKPYI